MIYKNLFENRFKYVLFPLAMIHKGRPPPKIFLYINKTKQKVDLVPCTHKNENILHKIANIW